MFLVIIANQLLVQRKVDLMGGNSASIILGNVNLMNHLFQGSKVLLNGLIHQNITVSQIEDLFLHIALQQTVNDLESSIGLACTGSHDQEKTILALGNGIHGSVDCNALIITRRIGVLTAVVGLSDNSLLRRSHSRFCLITRHQFCFRREFTQPKLPLFASQKIVLSKAITIGAVRKR